MSPGADSVRRPAEGRWPGGVLALALCLAAVAAPRAGALHAQQTGTVTGQVTRGDTGQPLPGAQVSITGTGLGALTNTAGRYLIVNVPPGEQTVEARVLGYGTGDERVTVAAGQSAPVDFVLRQQAIDLEAVVVTGTAGQARRREVGNSVAQLQATDIENEPIESVEEALQGRTSGVTISANNGMVGAGATIRIRGVNTISGGNTGNSPLIYVDGVRLTKTSPQNDPSGGGTGFDQVNAGISPLAEINPQDIERIEVIRGPAATTLYGTEASSGVIQIFTKSGTPGAAQWTLTTTHGFNQLPWTGPDDRDVNPAGMGLHRCNVTREEDPLLGIWFDPTCPEDGDWLRLGSIGEYNLSVRGGIEDVRYYLSGDFSQEEGVIAPQGQDKWGIRGNMAFDPTSTLNIQFNSSFGHRDVTWIPDGNNSEGFTLNVMRAGGGYTPENRNGLALEADLLQQVDHVISGVNVTWQPLPSLTQQLKTGLDYFVTEFTQEWPFGFYSRPLGLRLNNTWQNRTLTFDYGGTWRTDFGGTLSSAFSWGGQLFQEEVRRVTGVGQDFAGPGKKVLNSGARRQVEEERIETVEGGGFLQEQFGINDRLFITAGLRVDGNSRFGEDFGAQFYPKLSASYLVSDHDFWPAWWGSMKLRGAWGSSGRAPGAFDALRTFNSVVGDEGQPGVTPGNVGSPTLGPERSTELELGFEGSLFEDRLSVDFSYWRRTTDDALLSLPPIPSGGFVDEQVVNAGRIRGSGAEFSGLLSLIQSARVDWSVNGQLSFNHNEAVDLNGQRINFGPWPIFAIEGEPVPVYFGPRIQNPDAVGEAPVRREEIIGPTEPTRIFSLGTSLTLLRDLTLTTLFEGQGGHYLMAGTLWQSVRREVWPPCLGILQQIRAGDTSGLTVEERTMCDPQRIGFQDPIFPADFVRWRTLSLTYRVPDRWLPGGLTSGRITLGGQNLHIWTDYPDLDPEALEDGGRDFMIGRASYYQIPIPRRFTLSIAVAY